MEKKGYIKPDTTEMKLPEALLDYTIVSRNSGTADEDQEAGVKGGGVYWDWDDEEFDDEEEE